MPAHSGRPKAAAVPDPLGQPRGVGLDVAVELLVSDRGREVAYRITAQACEQSLDSVLGEVLHGMGFGIQSGLEMVVEQRGANRHTGVYSAAGQDVDRRKVFSEA